MVQKSATTSLSPKIILQEIHGNLQVKGWDRPEVLLRSSDDGSTLEAQDDSVNISSHGDCVIRLPHEADLQVLSVHGNTRIKLLEGQLSLDRVMGSLEVRNVESVQTGVIEGNLLAKQVTQDLVVDQVQGNAVARDVQGKCILKQVGGNLDLRDTEDDIEATVGGNVRLRLCMLVGQDYRIKAGGNLQCEVPEDASLVAELHSGAQRIKIQRPEGKSTLAEAQYNLTLGEGKSSMALKAGGAISFTAQQVDWEDMDEIQDEMDETFGEFSDEFGQQIADQVEAQIETQMEILNQNLAKLEIMIGKAGMPPEEADQVMQRARQATEKANLRAQERMRRAQEKLERKLQAAQRKSEMKMKAAERHDHTTRRHSWGIQWSTPPSQTSAAPVDEVATDEERLLILRMLEEKKISLQEAEELLTALEGK
jgi:SHOCT-like domain